MNKDLIFFNLGKLSVAREVLEKTAKSFYGYPEIANKILEAFYKLNEALNLTDKKFHIE